jgi:Domain of unknown function (DUF3492).
LLIAEGTYPYIRGGVSTWVHDLITGISEKNFGVVFLGSRPEDYEGIKYKLSDNLVYLSVDYLFNYERTILPHERNANKENFKYIETLHKWFKENIDKNVDLPEKIKKLEFF